MEESTYSILCIDDEENILKSMKRLLRKEGYRIFTTSSPEEGFAILDREKIQLVISDQRMPRTSGTEFLTVVRDRYPELIRIILTGYTDVDSITEAVNKGLIYKFLLKPWNDENLRLDIRQALEQYELVQTNKSLHQQILEQNEKLRLINESLEDTVRKRTHELEIKNQSLELARAVLEDVPVAIIGISAEGIIALTNQHTSRIPIVGSFLAVGNDLNDRFPTELTAEIMQYIKDRETIHLNGRQIGEAVYDIRLSPLSGRFHGRGVVLTIMPVS